MDDARANLTHAMDSGHRSYAWRERVYEFFVDNSQGLSQSTLVPPPPCTMAGHGVGVKRAEPAVPNERAQNANGRPFYEISATSEKIGKNGSYRVIDNLWFSRGSFYKIVDPGHPESGSPAALSSNINLYTIAVDNVTSFIQNTASSRFIQGETVLVDFSYFVHPTAIGHWLEYLLPLMSARRLEGLDASPPEMVIVMHLKRVFVFEWARAALGAAFGRDLTKTGAAGLGSAAGIDTETRTLPFPLIFQKETSSVWNQIGQRLEGVGDDEWVCFEKVIVAKDVIDDGPRTAFMDEGGVQDARRFRQQMWNMYNVVRSNRTDGTGTGKKRITLLHKSANRRIRNRASLRGMLAEFGEVNEVELTEAVPMASQIRIIANTDILVSTHTSGLANAVFLPPGALVVELRHRNFLEDMERTFEMQIKSLMDVRWIGWKAMDIVYLHEDDERKFKAWGTTCDVDECVEAHTLVDIIVDVDAVRELIVRNSL